MNEALISESFKALSLSPYPWGNTEHEVQRPIPYPLSPNLDPDDVAGRGPLRQVRPFWQVSGDGKTQWSGGDLGPGDEERHTVPGWTCQAGDQRRVRCNFSLFDLLADKRIPGSWSRNSRYVLTSSKDWNIIVWDLASSCDPPQRYSTLRFDAPVVSASFHPKNRCGFSSASSLRRLKGFKSQQNHPCPPHDRRSVPL